MNNDSDLELVDKILNSNKELFRNIIEKYKGKVLKIVLSHVPYNYAEEVSQEAFIEVYKSLGNFKGKCSLDSWISKITVRRCYQFWREQKKNKNLLVQSQDQEELDIKISLNSLSSFEDRSKWSDFKDLIYLCISELKYKERIVITMQYIEGHSQKEIASLLGWTLVNVKVSVWRAKRNLKAIMNKKING